MNWPVLGLLHQITQWEDSVIIVATPLLFPTALTLYGGFRMFFAAKAAAERRARQHAERQRQQERERIMKALAERGMPLTPEQAKVLTTEGDNN